jgi:hypothetical protein
MNDAFLRHYGPKLVAEMRREELSTTMCDTLLRLLHDDRTYPNRVRALLRRGLAEGRDTAARLTDEGRRIAWIVDADWNGEVMPISHRGRRDRRFSRP